jgi:putative peptidoglycan lipid II flippase
MIVALSYAHPNVGTLYRQRFGVLFFFILCGAIGWSRLVLDILSAASRRSDNAPTSAASNIDPHAALSHGMTRVAASGAIVLAISVVSFLGFMVRDLLLVKGFGMGLRLDAFFSAAMIPMFFVAFLAFPFADAMTAQFLRAGSAGEVEGREHLARSMLSFAGIVLAAFATLLAVTAEQLVALILGSDDPAQIEEAATMLRWFTPILVFSGWTVIGNSILNALQRSRAVALAQMSVPAIAIAAILAFGQTLGLYAAIYGMLAGLAANIVFVIYATRGEGLHLMPGRMLWSPQFIAVLRNYSLLVLAALLTAAAIPVNYAFAGMIGTGAVSAWALGSKMLQLVTGMAGVAIGAVILPHLGGLIARGRLTQLKSDVYFLLMSGTWISIFCTLTIYGFSEPLVVAVFEGGKVTREQAVQLAAILKLGSLQLPFVIATALILKLAAVSGTSLRAVAATGAGLTLNVALDLVLAPQSGVLGIATATVIAAGFSAVYLVLATRKQCGLDFVEVAVLLGNWIALLGLSVALHFRSVAAVASSGLALLVLAVAQWRVWQKRSPISVKMAD